MANNVKPIGGQWEIDWSHPLARGLQSFYLLNEAAGSAHDIARGFLGDLVSENESVAYWVKSGIYAGDSSPQSVFKSTNSVTLPNDSTIMMLCNPNVIGWVMYFGIGAYNDFSYYGSHHSGASLSTNESSYINKEHPLICTTSISDTTREDKVHIYDRPVGVASSTDLARSTGQFSVGGLDSFNDSSINGEVYCFAFWDSVLTDEEIKSLHENPYQILKQRKTVTNYAPLFSSGFNPATYTIDVPYTLYNGDLRKGNTEGVNYECP